MAVAALALVALVPALAAAQSGVPATPWGDPDLQGVWDYRTLTPLERPVELGDKAYLTEEEAAELERETLARNERLLTRERQQATASDQVDRREDGTPGFYKQLLAGPRHHGHRHAPHVADRGAAQRPHAGPDGACREPGRVGRGGARRPGSPRPCCPRRAIPTSTPATTAASSTRRPGRR